MRSDGLIDMVARRFSYRNDVVMHNDKLVLYDGLTFQRLTERVFYLICGWTLGSKSLVESAYFYRLFCIERFGR